MPADRPALFPAAVAIGAATAASRLRIGDFGLSDALQLARETRRSPVVLTLDLTRPLRDEDATGLAALRTRGRPTLRDVIEALDHAAGDDRVVGLVGRVGGTIGGLATVQELSAAITAFGATGKPTVVHCQTIGGEGGNGTLTYLLATAFREIHLQPTGDLALLGIASEVTFLRGALDKAGVEPQISHRHEYKNAANVFTERDFTPAHREAVESLVESWATQIVDAVARQRGVSADAVREAIEAAPLFAQDALDRGLVDRLAYRDESIAEVRTRVPDDTRLLPLTDYRPLSRAREHWRTRRAPVVALIEARGAIMQERRQGPMSSPVVTADAMGAALRRAADDDEIAAVVLHIDSPGGSAVASDAIWRAVHTTRRAGKPVVAWMGDVAGSGGYYIAMCADRIVAQPGTLTGSIGVVFGKAVTSELQHKVGLETRAVSAGPNARFFSSSSAYDDAQRARLEEWLDHVYDYFTAKVADDRGMSRERVHELARGRIWTGQQAHERGLVDRLGGYREALAATRELLDLPADAALRVHPYPPAPSLPERLRGREVEDPFERDVAALVPALTDAASLTGDPAALVDLLSGMVRPAGVLTMPFVPRLR